MIYILLAIIIAYFSFDYYVFKNSNYHEETNINYLRMRFDKGNYGEYLIFNKLKKVDGYSRVLLNVYIPKDNGDNTELDLIFVHEKGIYVVESKNYSGWIYGDEKSLKWTQTFQNGKKFKFYNPIKQNKTHIKHLEENLKEIYSHNYFSLIVFSERCRLKKIKYVSDHLKVLNRNNINRFLKTYQKEKFILLTEDEVDYIYNHLSKYTKVTDAVKQEHINKINKIK